MQDEICLNSFWRDPLKNYMQVEICLNCFFEWSPTKKKRFVWTVFCGSDKKLICPNIILKDSLKNLHARKDLFKQFFKGSFKTIKCKKNFVWTVVLRDPVKNRHARRKSFEQFF